jgi:ParB family chromosome partitioning protein
MTSHQFIPLNRLVVSRLNVRRTDRKADIDALAASIAAHGLLQNLTVAATATDKYEVVAGSRRLAALKSLVKTGAIARDFAVPCQIVESDGAGEVSLAENVQRVAMDAMDEVDAFSSLAEADQSSADIARRFGISERHVEQRLALAALSPKIKAAYRRGDLTLDAARAFCLVEDHAKQDAVFKALSKPITHPGSVRNQLMQGRMRRNDRVAVFVGLEAYEAAGGKITRDLFDTDDVYVDDPALMNKLAHDRLDAVRDDALSQGWAWVEVNVHQQRFESAYGARLHPSRRAMTTEEQAESHRLEAEIEQLEQTLHEAEDEDESWATLDARNADLEALRANTQEWDADMMRHAGVILSIGHNGAPNFAYGVVRKADQKKINEIQRRREQEATRGDAGADEGDGSDIRDDADADAEHDGPRLPKALVLSLTLARTQAVRKHVGETPRLGLALAVFALARSSIAHQPPRGVGLRAATAGITDYQELEDARESLAARVPTTEADMLTWCMSQSSEDLLSALALLISDCIDLTHAGVTAEERNLQAIGDAIATEIGLDMTQFWSPDLTFWSQLPKAMLLDVLAKSPRVTSMRPRENAAFLKAHAKLKKDDLARATEKALDGAGWLPAPLVTPDRDGRYELTDAGLAAVEAAA